MKTTILNSMHQTFPPPDLHPSKYLQDDYIVRFYREAQLCVNELAILRDVCSRLGYEGTFENESLSLLLYFETPIISRFFKWLEFLLQLKHTVYFEGLIKALVFCFKGKKLVHLQTESQFEQSQRFLLELKSAETKKDSLIASKTFFLCVLICSRRPDLMAHSIKQLLYRQEQDQFDFKNRWFHLFFGEKNSFQFLGRHLEELSGYEIELLIASLSGESLRRDCQDFFPMSQKEQALLFSGSIELEQPDSRILERYIIAARLLKVKPKGILLMKYLTQTKAFKEEFDRFTRDIEFWQAVFTVLYKEWVKDAEGMMISQIPHLLDHIEFQRYVPLRPLQYSVRGRTFDSMVRDMNEWHNTQNFRVRRKDLRQRWEPLSFGIYTTQIDNIEYRVQELNTGVSLLKEGRKMKHCVMSYINSCISHSTHIFSIKQRKTRGYKHLATIEVQDNTVAQAQSTCNRRLNEIQMEILGEWMEAVGLEEGRWKGG